MNSCWAVQIEWISNGCRRTKEDVCLWIRYAYCRFIKTAVTICMNNWWNLVYLHHAFRCHGVYSTMRVARGWNTSACLHNPLQGQGFGCGWHTPILVQFELKANYNWLQALEDVVLVVGSCHCNCDENTAHESMINVSSALNYYPPLKFGTAPRQIGEVRIEWYSYNYICRCVLKNSHSNYWGTHVCLIGNLWIQY